MMLSRAMNQKCAMFKVLTKIIYNTILKLFGVAATMTPQSRTADLTATIGAGSAEGLLVIIGAVVVAGDA